MHPTFYHYLVFTEAQVSNAAAGASQALQFASVLPVMLFSESIFALLGEVQTLAPAEYAETSMLSKST